MSKNKSPNQAPTAAELAQAKPVTAQEREALEGALQRVVFALYLDYPFYVLLAERCRMIFTHGIPTAAVTDDARMLFNPTYFMGLSEPQRMFLIAHEVMHLAFRHHARRLSRDPELWNQATDYLINALLVQDFQKKSVNPRDAMPPGGLYDSSIDTNELAAEDLYEILMNLPESQGGGGGSARGAALAENHAGTAAALERGHPDRRDAQPDLLDASGADLEDAAAEGGYIRENRDTMPEDQAEWESAVAQAAVRSKMMGKLPAHLDMAVTDFLKPKIEWTKQLISKVSMEVCREYVNDYTWTIPNRRFIGSDIVLPTTIGYRTKIATCVDTSGSMSDAWMQACSDLEYIRKRFNIETYHMWADADVIPHGWLKPEQPFPKTAFGGGGTSFVPAFEHLRKTKIDREISMLIYFSDLYGAFGEQPKEYETVWVSYSDAVPPWGDLIQIKD